MRNYEPPFTITNKMLGYVASISEKVAKITSRRQLDTKPHLRRNNRIKSIHSSLKIEANSLSLSEVRDVINGKTVLGDLQEIREVKNAYMAYEEGVFSGDTCIFVAPPPNMVPELMEQLFAIFSFQKCIG